MTNSTIRFHYYHGVRVSGNNIAASNPVVTVNQSSIYSNGFNNYYTEFFGNAASTTLDARNNWWGAADVNTIEGSIVHRFDNSVGNYPWVDYSGYLDGIGGNPVTGNPGLQGDFSSNTTISAGSYDMLSDLTVNAGVTVTIGAGVTISSDHTAFNWEVNGTLLVQGASGNPVVFTSAKAVPAPGQWNGIIVNAGGNLVMDYGIVEYAGEGLYFKAGSTGTVTNSTIRFHYYHGVRVSGNNIAASNPVVTVNQSSIYSNGFNNYYTEFFGNAASTTLDARNNWWGTTDENSIEAEIYHRIDVPTGNYPWVDSFEFLDAAGGIPFFAIYDHVVTAGTVNPHKNLIANLHFKTNTPASSRVRVYETNGSVILNEFNQSHAIGESFDYQWDGKDQSGSLVPDGIYRMELYVTDGTNQFTWDPVAGGEEGSNSGTVPVSFDAYKNDFFKIDLNVQQTSLVTMRVTPFGETVFNAIDQQAYGAGNHAVMWDGRRPDGSIITGATDFFFEAPINLRANDVVVKVGTPQISGPGASPNIEVKSDPYLITHSYEQISTITFRIDQDSDVTFKLLPPGIYDPADPSAITMINNQLLLSEDGGGAPLDHSVQWLGHDGVDTNDILVTDEGAYTFTIEATSAVSGVTTLYRGSLQIRP